MLESIPANALHWLLIVHSDRWNAQYIPAWRHAVYARNMAGFERHTPGMPRHIYGGLGFPADMYDEFAKFNRTTLHPPDMGDVSFTENTYADVKTDAKDPVRDDAGSHREKGHMVKHTIAISSSSNDESEDEEQMPSHNQSMRTSSNDLDVSRSKRRKRAAEYDHDTAEDQDDSDEEEHTPSAYRQLPAHSNNDVMNNYSGDGEHGHSSNNTAEIRYKRRETNVRTRTQDFVVPDSLDSSSYEDIVPEVQTSVTPGNVEPHKDRGPRRSTRARQPRTLFDGLVETVKHVEA
jgi:hypothetical protein